MPKIYSPESITTSGYSKKPVPWPLIVGMLLLILTWSASAAALTIAHMQEIKDQSTESMWNSLPDCPTEDSADSMDCKWDATQRGNGKGRSFYSLNGEIHYVRCFS